MNIIELKNIHKFFGQEKNKVHVLKGINLSIQKGDFVAIIGQSGSGKSTMMNIIGCLDTPTSGSYKINGVEVGKMGKDQLAELRCKTFGFIFQRYNLLNSLKASEFSLRYTPQLLPVLLRCVSNAPLPMSLDIPQLRCRVSAPDIFGAGPLDQ